MLVSGNGLFRAVSGRFFLWCSKMGPKSPVISPVNKVRFWGEMTPSCQFIFWGEMTPTYDFLPFV